MSTTTSADYIYRLCSSRVTTKYKIRRKLKNNKDTKNLKSVAHARIMARSIFQHD
jgi:hypothetical protein